MPTKKKAAVTKKSTVKKSAAKKAGTKGSAKKAQKKKALICANGEQCFWTTDGEILSNLVELRDALERMSTEVFSYHVTKDKNDFADWIGEVLADHELAKSIRTAKKPSTARTVVVRRLKLYQI